MTSATTRDLYDKAYRSSRRHILLLVIVLLAVTNAVPSTAAEGSIAVSSQPDGYVCFMMDASPGLRTVYVLHTFNQGSSASRFRITNGPGFTMTYVSETHPFSQTLGDTQAGISVCYGTCLVGNQLLATIQYMSFGTSTVCSNLLVKPHPQAQTVEAIDCNFVPVVTFVQDLTINTATGSCGCPSPHTFPGIAQQFGCDPVAVWPTTWGAIKALYQR